MNIRKTQAGPESMAAYLLNKKYWMSFFIFVTVVSVLGLIYLGGATYTSAPPIVDFVSKESGEVFIKKEAIDEGQKVFLQRGLMNYGSFWGDGAERGPDFTADSIHQINLSMIAYYQLKSGKSDLSADEKEVIATKVKREFKENGYNSDHEQILVPAAEAEAFQKLVHYYLSIFKDQTNPIHIKLGYELSEEELKNLTAFFYWGAWVAVANRPGENYSYTHNWPHDPAVGNTPSPAIYIWSFLSIFILFLGTMLILYVYGQMKAAYPDPFDMEKTKGQWLTTSDLESDTVRATQRATYKFFALAMAVFGVQVLVGIVCATDFIRPFGLYLGNILPFPVARSFHTLFQIYWFFMCWVGYTIFFLARLAKVPKGQQKLINLLFVLCVIVGVGALFGIYLGNVGILKGEMNYWFGNQGWEFMELGRFFQILLLVAFSLWIFIIYRGVKPWLTRKNLWSVPSWLLYGSGIMVFFLFFGLFVTPKTNFAIADYWRWMVVHMWVEVTFEVFTTVIVAYIMVQMNFINKAMAERAIFLAVMLFLFTATLGIAHNFYWIAKPTGIIALGSVFSTMQVLPLLLLTLDAWEMRKKGELSHDSYQRGNQNTVMGEVWLFILAVNFWNIFGAGVLGSLINLPIVNYFEHATYLTNNHAHGAMFGVKGNIALAGMLFCLQHLFPKKRWNAKLVRTSFWCLNIGIALMMFLDLFPVGLYQMIKGIEYGFWYARSHEIVSGPVFKTLTYFRSVGGTIFVFGGLIPMIWFVLSRGTELKQEEVVKVTQPQEQDVIVDDEEWVLD